MAKAGLPKVALAAVSLVAGLFLLIAPAREVEADSADNSSKSLLSRTLEAYEAGNYKLSIFYAERALGWNTPGKGEGGSRVVPEAEVALSIAELAELLRVGGICHFHLHAYDKAEKWLLSYLRIELDGQLDPMFHPPELVLFFDELRVNNQAELQALRPRPVQKKRKLLNFLPPLGQFQNGHRAKGWLIAGMAGLSLASNIGSYITLESWCGDDGTCESDGRDRTSAAKLLRQVNLVSVVVLVGTLVYGVVDANRHFDGQEDGAVPGLGHASSIRIGVGLGGAGEGSGFFLSGRF